MNKGALFALGAAFLNATVGVLSLASFATGMGAINVAFYKCLASFLVLSCLVVLHQSHWNGVKTLKKHRGSLAIMAFFGFFCL